MTRPIAGSLPRLGVLAVVASVTSVSGCDRAPVHGATETSDRVVHLQDSAVGFESTILFEPDSLASASRVAASPDGSWLAVLDARSQHLAVYRFGPPPTTRYIGGVGDGPGRTRCANRVVVHDGLVEVLDRCRDVLVVESPDGVERTRVRLPAADVTIRPNGDFGHATGGLLLERGERPLLVAPADDGRRYARRELVLVNGGGEASILRTIRETWINLKDAGPAHLIPLGHDVTLRWAVSPDGEVIAVAAGDSGSIELFDGAGGPLESLRLPIAPIPVRDEDRRAYRESFREFVGLPGPTGVSPSALDRVAVASRVPPIRTLRFDPAGRLWIELVRDDAGDSNGVTVVIADVAAATGVRVALPCFPAAHLAPDRFVCVESDSLGIDRLRQVRLVPDSR